MAYVLSSLALATSLASLVVSILNYRSSGPRIRVVSHTFAVRSGELWLEVKVANAGKAEVDLDGASCDVLGPTANTLPYRLKSAASHVLVFRAPIAAHSRRIGSATVNVGLGSGRTTTSQVRLTDAEQAALATAIAMAAIPRTDSAENPTIWYPPTQEQL